MTLKEFLTGCVKILGLVILLYGVGNTANAILAAGAVYSTARTLKNVPASSSDAEYEAQLHRQMRAAEFKSKGDIHLIRIPYALIQIGFGLYLCRREHRIVQFLLKP